MRRKPRILATQIGPISRLIREKAGTDDDRAALGTALADAFEAYSTPDGIHVPAAVIVYSACKA